MRQQAVRVMWAKLRALERFRPLQLVTLTALLVSKPSGTRGHSDVRVPQNPLNHLVQHSEMMEIPRQASAKGVPAAPQAMPIQSFRTLALSDGFINRQCKVVEARKGPPIMHLCKHSQLSGADWVQIQTVGCRDPARLRDPGFETGYCPLIADNCFIAAMTSASAPGCLQL